VLNYGLAVGAVVAFLLLSRPAPEESSAPVDATGSTAPPDGSRRTPPLPGEKPGGSNPAAPEPPPTRPGAGPAVLAGFVLDAEAGAPVPRARVRLSREAKAFVLKGLGSGERRKAAVVLDK
jgi:hypothetical protein